MNAFVYQNYQYTRTIIRYICNTSIHKQGKSTEERAKNPKEEQKNTINFKPTTAKTTKRTVLCIGNALQPSRCISETKQQPQRERVKRESPHRQEHNRSKQNDLAMNETANDTKQWLIRRFYFYGIKIMRCICLSFFFASYSFFFCIYNSLRRPGSFSVYIRCVNL